MPAISSRRLREGGSVLVYVALLCMVLIGLAGLAIDTAVVASASQQLQHAADGAALNAARHVATESDSNFPVTRAAAVSVALANQAAKTTVKLDANTSNAPGGDIVVGVWDFGTHTFTPTLIGPNAVRVHAVRDMAHTDGPL